MAVLFNLIDSSVLFIKQNFDDILLVSLGLLIFLLFKYQTDILKDRRGLNTNTNTKKEVKRTIIIEGMKKHEVMDMMEASYNEPDICDIKNSTEEKNELCMKQSDEQCNLRKCCVLAMKKGDKKATCLAGDELDGPIYKLDKDGNRMNFDYYYYRNKCHGRGCPKPKKP